jgi:ABC-2 type transport system permease protein
MTEICLKEAKYELLKKLRVPMFTVCVLGFPLMFYVLFGILMNGRFGHIRAATYLLGTYGTFAVIGVCIFGLAVNLAIERDLGWLELRQASPMPLGPYFVSKVIMCSVFSLVLLIILLALGILFGHVEISAVSAVKLMAVLMAGVVPFSAMALLLGFLVKGSSAPSFFNMIFLPMSFCSGLWMPIFFMPRAVQQIAPYLPPYHLSRLALGAIGINPPSSYATHWEALAGYTFLFLGLTFLLVRRRGIA